ncbi:MAG: DUF6057 family protein, partial [Bacteroidales bacterium]|nr:DUF6057 family protein [Bacteroidales bacterium]
MKPGIDKRKFFAINFYIITAVFFVVSIVWMLQHIKYHVLQQHEQLQLFRTGWSYFTGYMGKPGGLLSYTGAFFSQFFFNHWIAASVMGGIIVLIYIIYILVCRKKGNIYPVFSLTMILPVLLLMCVADPQIKPSYLLGLLTCISFFLFFLQLKVNNRYIGGIILIVLAYFLSGGNGLLLGIFIIIDEMFRSERSWWFIGTVSIIMAVVPYCAWQMIYLVPLREAYFSLLPFNLIFPNKIAIITWILFPAFYAIWNRSGHFLSTVLYK